MFYGVINRKILARKPNESEIDTFHTLVQRSSGENLLPTGYLFFSCLSFLICGNPHTVLKIEIGKTHQNKWQICGIIAILA